MLPQMLNCLYCSGTGHYTRFDWTSRQRCGFCEGTGKDVDGHNFLDEVAARENRLYPKQKYNVWPLVFFFMLSGAALSLTLGLIAVVSK